MLVRFDRGTLVFENVPSEVDLGEVPGIRFDPRVKAWRARACDKDVILRELACRGVDIVDETERAFATVDPVPPLELRAYQQAALQAWDEHRRRGVVVLPTGAGKTRIAIAAIARTLYRAIILVPTRVLMEQWREELFRSGFKAVGAYGDHQRDLAAVTVATMDAAWRWMHKLGDAFELLIVDEVHRSVGETRAEALEMSIAPFRLGLTATPPGIDLALRVERLVGPIVFQATLEELAGKYLSAFDLVVLPVELNKIERAQYDAYMQVFRKWADDQQYVHPELSFEELMKRARRSAEGRAALDAFRRAQNVLSYPEHKRLLVGELLAEHRARKVLVFTPDNKTAYAISREFLVAPITCDIARPERERILARFREGAIRSLVSSQVLNEGVNVPDADVAIIVGGRSGKREHVQRVGRVLRPVAGKQALVVELVVSRTMEQRAGLRRREYLGAKI